MLAIAEAIHPDNVVAVVSYLLSVKIYRLEALLEKAGICEQLDLSRYKELQQSCLSRMENLTPKQQAVFTRGIIALLQEAAPEVQAELLTFLSSSQH